MQLDHEQKLGEVVGSHPDLRYAFAASSHGIVLGEAGYHRSLPDAGLVDVLKRPESISALYEECLELASRDPRMLPRMWSQGRTQGFVGVPVPATLVAVFGEIPDPVATGAPAARAQWSYALASEVWPMVESSYGG